MYTLYRFIPIGITSIRYFLVHTLDDAHYCYYSSDTIKGAFNSLHSYSASALDSSERTGISCLGNFDSYDDVVSTAPELLI